MSSSPAAIFFDGASKGNPGILGAGGLVFSPNRLTKLSFSWGLGTMSNNLDKSYRLLMEIQFAKEKGSKSIQFFGDSEMLIKALNSTDSFNNYTLNKSLQIIHNILKEFDTASSFHILRVLNNLVDALSNKSCLLP